MRRLLIHVEGQTEEDFVNEMLRGHLVSRGYHSVEARLVGNARLREQRGGIRSWLSVRKEIANHLLGDPGCIATTMIDYYGLPRGQRAWPGRVEAINLPVGNKASCVQSALAKDFSEFAGSRVRVDRFIPFVVMHEFEGLLFSDCQAFARGIGRPELESKFKDVRAKFDTPEHINDSPDTAPSKRVLTLVPSYEKPLFGVLAALEIGLTRIRAECPHFDGWIQDLESRATESHS